MDRKELLIQPVAHMAAEQILDGLMPQEAARRVLGLPHNIVEILAHVVFWQARFLDLCLGKTSPMIQHAADGWPEVGEGDWVRVKEQFLQDLSRAVELPATGPIDPPIEFGPMSHYGVEDVMVHISQHNGHHLGQIVLIRQALGLWPPLGGSYTW